MLAHHDVKRATNLKLLELIYETVTILDRGTKETLRKSDNDSQNDNRATLEAYVALFESRGAIE